MKGEIIECTIRFKCLYTEGECKYKHPMNKRSCVGCVFSQVISQNPPKIINENG